MRRSPRGRRRAERLDRHLSLVFAALLIAAHLHGTASAQRGFGDDFDPESRAWNGLSALVSAARASEVTLILPERLDVQVLRPEDGLLIINPSRALPLSDLAEFMRSGGRVALAEDSGSGAPLLGLYQIERRLPDISRAPLLRGNPALPVAKVLYDHPLTQGISFLITNHPNVVSHEALAPLVAFESSQEAVLLTGAVGAGRLVVLADSSVLINNMQELSDNRRFTANLLRYLAGERGGRVFLIVGDATLVGSYGGAEGAPPFARFRAWLEDIAHFDLPPEALLLLASTIALLLLLFVVSNIPRRSPYRASLMLPSGGPPGGLEGRVRFFVDRPSHLMLPVRVFKLEFESKLRRLLELDPRAPRRAIVEAARGRGIPAADVASLDALLGELASLRALDDAPGAAPKIRQSRLRRMVDTGVRVIEALAPHKEAR